MKWKEYSLPKGSHALFGGSNYHWINYTQDDFINKYRSSLASKVGTAVHDAAKTLIDGRIKITENDWNLIRYILEENELPRNVDCVPILQNLIPYVNDAIAYGMDTEVLLYYSDNFFGTADTICFDEKKKLLRIHDLKTGLMPGHMEQLLVYMALFCLSYKYQPYEIEAELRIYQHGEILYLKPELEEVVPIIDQIITGNKLITELKAEEV